MAGTWRKTLILLFVHLLGACASGMPYSEMAIEQSAANPEKGRIFFYRNTTFGAAVVPEVRLNGEVVGQAQPKGFFYVDRPPGEYVVATTTEVERLLSFVLEPGQTRYVKFKVGLGFFVGHVYGELVENQLGMNEIAKCKHIEYDPNAPEIMQDFE